MRGQVTMLPRRTKFSNEKAMRPVHFVAEIMFSFKSRMFSSEQGQLVITKSKQSASLIAGSAIIPRVFHVTVPRDFQVQVRIFLAVCRCHHCTEQNLKTTFTGPYSVHNPPQLG